MYSTEVKHTAVTIYNVTKKLFEETRGAEHYLEKRSYFILKTNTRYKLGRNASPQSYRHIWN